MEITRRQGPSRDTGWHDDVDGVVGAQLWPWQRTATRKAATAMAWICGGISGPGARCYYDVANTVGPLHKPA